MKREFLKYEICKFTIISKKNKPQFMQEVTFRKKLELLEGKLECNEAKDGYNVCKENLNFIYNEIANGIKISNRCNWY